MKLSIPRFPVAAMIGGFLLVAPVLAAWKSVALKSGNAMISAIAVGDSVIATGLSEGGVRLVDRFGQKMTGFNDPGFGSRGRVYDLAWLGDRLVVASEGGVLLMDPRSGRATKLERASNQGVLGVVRALHVRGNELWMGGSKTVSVLEGSGAGKLRSWKLPTETDLPQCLLLVGNSVLVGTANSGLLILDAPSGSWNRIGRDEGLPENQITGMEMVGERIFAGTSRGLGVIELSSRAITVAAAGMVTGWMTQINGALVVSTFDGLVRVDGTSLVASRMPLDEGLVPEGSVTFERGILASGGSNGRLLILDRQTVLGSDPLEVVPEGFRLKLSSPLPAGSVLSAQLRMPEWPAAAVPAEIMPTGSPTEKTIRLPTGAAGRFILEMNLLDANTLLERRTMEVVADRSPPLLVLDEVPGWSKDSVVSIRGRATAPSGVSLFRSTHAEAIDLDEQGRFDVPIKLAQGANLIRFKAVDGAGNGSEREVSIVRDGLPPWLQEIPPDTVDDTRTQLRLAMREPNLRTSKIEPTEKASMIVTDSALLLDLRDLSTGRNLFRIRLQDMAGNLTERTFAVVRPGPETSAPLVDPDETARSKDAAKPKDATKNVKSDSCGCPASRPSRQAASPSRQGVVVVRYGMKEGETIRKVAERFYGNRELANVLIRWNSLEDSAQWRRMPVGTALDVPFWSDFEHGGLSPAEALAILPKRATP